jgi:hypothetical protein
MAQKAPKLEVFGGYSYLQLTEQPSIQLKSAGLNGWNASAKLNVMPRVGLLADFSSYYGRREMTPYTIDLTMSGEPQTRAQAPGACFRAASPRYRSKEKTSDG